MRSRILRPRFFQNEDLARLPMAARLLFQGLWLLADRAGRLEDRPARIRAELFPYEELDVDPFLDALAAAGFISRYLGADGRRCIHVVKFQVHQTPHLREAESSLPPPPDSHENLKESRKPRLSPEKAGLSTDLGSAEPKLGRRFTDPGSVSDPGSDPGSVWDPVPDPEQDPEDQDQPAPPVFPNADEPDPEPEPDPAFRVYAAIASAALQELAVERQPDDLGTLTARFKQLCAKQGRPYDADIARRAVDAARHARDKAAAKFKALFPARPPRDPASDPWQHVAQPPGSAEAAARASTHVKGRRR